MELMIVIAAAILAWVVREQNGDIRILQWLFEEG